MEQQQWSEVTYNPLTGDLPDLVQARILADIAAGGFATTAAITAAVAPKLDAATAAATYTATTALRKGLAPVNPTERCLLGMPTVMATPPTVTVGAANAASAIASPQTITIANNPGWFLGNPAGFGSSFPDNAQWKAPDQIAFFGQVPTIGASGAWANQVMHDGSQIEFQSKQQTGAAWRIRVDGQLVTSSAQVGPTTSPGSGYRVLVDFGGVRQIREITLEMSGPCRLGDIVIGPNDTLWTPGLPVGPSCIIVGDSFTDGTAANSQITAFGKTFGDAMGWKNVRQSGEGSTGYLTNPGGGKQTYRQRVPLDIAPWNPDVVMVMGSINDDSQTAANVGAEATLLFAAIKAAAPNAKLVVLLPFHVTSTANQPAATVANRDAIKTAATGVANLIIDPIAEGWFTGTGRVGATTGTGNGDLYLYTDSAHPTQAAHDYIGRRTALKLAAAMAAGTL